MISTKRPILALLAMTAALAGCSCASDAPGNPAGTPGPKVGNNDPRGVDNQPDWDTMARDLAQRLEGRVSDSAADGDEGARQKACDAMLDAAREFYEATERDPLRKGSRLALLEETRSDDLKGCLAHTSIRATECVTMLLGQREGEYPFVLDQCMRAFPLAGRAPAGGADANSPEAQPRKDAIELTFVGDIIFGRYRDAGFDPIVKDGHDPFAEVASLLAADVVIGNLETPVLESIPEKSPIYSKYRFAAGRDEVKLLRRAGFDVVSQANNHFFDLREPGMIEGPKIIAEEGILPVGTSRPAGEGSPFRIETFEKDGWKIGFLALTTRRNAPQFEGAPVLPFSNLRDLPDIALPLLEQARADHDLLVVYVHWGEEYAEDPGNATRRVAHALIDGGADILVGHHPHVLQGIEHYNGHVIAYSMGNFLFEHTGAVPRLTGVLRTRFQSSGPREQACLRGVTFHPAVMTRLPIRHPAAATEGMAKRVRTRVSQQASRLDSSFATVEGSEDLILEGLPACP